MTKEEFTDVFKDFSQSYGTKYPENQTQMIWDYVKEIGAGQLDVALGSLIEKHRTPPSVAAIRDVCRKLVFEASNRRKERQISEIRSRSGCRFCLATGLISAFKRDSSDQPYAFRCQYCSCADILKLSKNIPAWSDGLSGLFDMQKID